MTVAWLAQPVQHLAALYQSEFSLEAPDPQYLLALFACAVLFGWLGAWFAVGRHWRSVRPT
jgi:cell division transport system permease protein